MYLRTVTSGRHEYVQMCHNYREGGSGPSKTRVLFSLGRKDELDVEALRRLVASISRYLDPAEAAEPGQLPTPIRTHNVAGWTAWCHEVRAGPENPIRRFVLDCSQDQEAIDNVLTHPHNNGPAEGNVTRLKLLRRSAYGRASFELLRRA